MQVRHVGEKSKYSPSKNITHQKPNPLKMAASKGTWHKQIGVTTVTVP